MRKKTVFRYAFSLYLLCGLHTSEVEAGVNDGSIAHAKFTTPVTLVHDSGRSQGDIGDIIKIQLLNSERSAVGLALLPFINFPTGDAYYFTGDKTLTGGGKLVVDTKRFGKRVSFSLNGGGLMRKDSSIVPGIIQIDDQFLYGIGANVKLARPVQCIVQINGSTSIKHLFAQNNNNLEVDAAVRFLPGKKKNWLITTGGGTGILTKGGGVPDYRLFASIGFKFPRKENSAKIIPPLQ